MTAPTAVHRGYFEKIYIDTADDWDTPTFVEIEEAEDGQWSVTPKSETVMLKKHGGIEREIPYGAAIAASFNVKALPVGYLSSRAYYAKLRDASLSGVPVLLQMADGNPSGAGVEVLKAWWTVTFSKSAPSGGTVDVSITLAPSDSPAGESPEITVTEGP
ncbi:hypothetical protein [Thalassoglobus polymorphus]|uniref:Phage major tail protein 2 n=1 Tax=Thalassoglobus polymorphus TaxID=2527994 RepID=A0A517QH46_9PLAN|nr:hypothetical protein [Thalassoglobus polymorphus]QDT30935.1 hypothetical protein Mal48_01640 [Thalassoglobus polymorphus]QDT30980.1 hypothetical protein Mal48_02090 [Thalassoglobus polymorphus]